MSQTVKFSISVEEPKNRYTDFKIYKEFVMQEKVEATYILNSVDSVTVDLSPMENLYVAVISATAPVTVTLTDGYVDYSVFNGYIISVAPSTIALLSYDRMVVESSIDNLSVNVGIFGT